MKKMITLFLAAISFVAVQAQTSREEARRVILGQPKSGGTTQKPRDVVLGDRNGTSYPAGSRDAEINEIHRDYDAKIQGVRNNPFLSAAEKERRIRELEIERDRKIREINNRYGDRNSGRYDGDDYKSKKNKNKAKKAKGNNGKHLGWEKGKGNPHKNGGKVKKHKD